MPSVEDDGLNASSSGSCSHTNPICTCTTSDADRAALLEEYLDVLAEGGWANILLMPLEEDGKGPVIAGRCSLLGRPEKEDLTGEAKGYLHTPEEAVDAVRAGHRGFCLYAGRDDLGTAGLVFTDHDDPAIFPADADSLTVVSGSGAGYHQTFENTGNVQNAKAKSELKGAGEVRADNLYVVLPGSIHPSGGIYHIESNSGIAPLEPDDLPEELLPSTDKPTKPNSDPPPVDTDVPESLGDIEADFSVEHRYRILLNCEEEDRIKAVIEGNYAEAGFRDDRHQAEGWFAEQVGFYMRRERDVIEQVLQKIFTENPETDAHTGNPEKSSRRKFLENDYHREQILDYATSTDSTYDPGFGAGRWAVDRPEVSYVTIERVRDALADLTLARRIEIEEHPRPDRSTRQIQQALREMQEEETVRSVEQGRKKYYYLTHHELLIPKERREELGIEVPDVEV
jgi:hypothetical protein